MKLATNPNLPTETLSLLRLLSEITQQVNGISEGRMANRHTALMAPPATGSASKGDVVFNSAPTELGVAGSKYVVPSFICVVSGTPGTWVQMRCLTGN